MSVPVNTVLVVSNLISNRRTRTNRIIFHLFNLKIDCRVDVLFPLDIKGLANIAQILHQGPSDSPSQLVCSRSPTFSRTFGETCSSAVYRPNMHATATPSRS